VQTSHQVFDPGVAPAVPGAKPESPLHSVMGGDVTMAGHRFHGPRHPYKTFPINPGAPAS
jgi:hypothetical protein